MSDLKIRRIPFTFGDDTPFLWNPRNPSFSLLCNGVTFAAPAFERYIVAAVRAARPSILDTVVGYEADQFLRQEAIHARAHQLHASALIAQYPGLQETFDSLNAAYEQLWNTESLDFHLAYIADVEATFTPFFGMCLEHRSELFEGGDSRVASLFLWHFVEEIEHRSSAFTIYNHVVQSKAYRLRVLPRVLSHVSHLNSVALAGFNEHVPMAGRRLVASPRTARRAFAEISMGARAAMIWRLSASQWPMRNPEDERIPAFAAEWIRAYDEGHDIRDWFSTSTAV